MDDHAEFVSERQRRIASYGEDESLRHAGNAFCEESIRARYSYNFEWLGLPIIQYPQDMQALQEVIWRTRPDCIIETGVARGGSLVFYASMLELLGGDGMVVGIDIDIRQHNRKRIVEHPLARRIRLIDGSSIDPATVAAVCAIAGQHERIMVCLDSNHTHAHVLAELQSYAPLVSPGCYCVVFDTIIELMPGLLRGSTVGHRKQPEHGRRSIPRPTDPAAGASGGRRAARVRNRREYRSQTAHQRCPGWLPATMPW